LSDAIEAEYRAYLRGLEATLSLIRGERFASRSAAQRRQRAESKLARSRELLVRFGNPQRRYPTVHVTGTSGKGSTAAGIAAILTAAGYRVGLRTSPYLQVATEKLQIGSSLIDGPSFEQLAHRVLAEAFLLPGLDDPGQHLSYAELWTVMSFLWFAEREVDIAIIEVGAGGRFDTSNVIEPVISVITSVGLDHVISLGPTVTDIAWHKAGIIKRGSIAVVGDVSPDALAVIEAEARLVDAPLRRLSAQDLGPDRPLGMVGDFQQTNARIAVRVAQELTCCGFAVPQSAIESGLAEARLPGRLERMSGAGSLEIWLDGAHNEDKIAALAGESHLFSAENQLPVLVIGLLGAKDAAAIAAQAATIASAIVVTEPNVVGKQSRSASELAQVVKSSGFRGPITVEPDAAVAVQQAEQFARGQHSNVVVTGSMYLVGQARRRWFPDRDVVLQRTSWPQVQSTITANSGSSAL
jgi:dihydrofolate synthase / folylpolyglutamate synthase